MGHDLPESFLDPRAEKGRLQPEREGRLRRNAGNVKKWRFLPVQINSSSVNFPPWSDVVVMQQQ
jgi:hypothetical protein